METRESYIKGNIQRRFIAGLVSSVVFQCRATTGLFKLELEKELSGISCQDSFPGYKLEDHHSISDIKIQQKTNLDDSSNATIGVF